MVILAPDNAIQAMKQGNWSEAADLWHQHLRAGGRLSAADFQAMARVHECLGDWDAYACIIAEGLEAFPADEVLAYRRRHAEAIACTAQARWSRAWELLERLRLDPVKAEWPCALHYWRWQVRYRQAVADVVDSAERLASIAELSLFKSSELWPWRVAGLSLAVDCQAWPQWLRADFIQVLEPVIQCLRRHDVPVRLIDDAQLGPAVAGLAAFWHEYWEHLAGLPAGYYEFLARLFLCHGHLDLYERLRGHFSQLLEQINAAGKPVDLAQFLYRVALANEQGDLRAFENFSARNVRPAEAGEVARYLALSAIYYADAAYVLDTDERDSEFYEYIRGRSIAIVGPVDVGLDSGEEIEGFDRIVRFNHRASVSYDEARFGRRTDISYYVRVLLAGEPRSGIQEGMAELDYAVIDRHSWRECNWLNDVLCRKRERPDLTDYLNNPLLFGYAHAVQRAVLDLLRFRPARIKVFSADLYTSMGYGQDYLKDSRMGRNGGNVFPGLSVHDPISNFLLMQRLYQRQAIEVDAVLQRVLGLTVPQYLDCLRAGHGPFLVETSAGERRA